MHLEHVVFKNSRPNKFKRRFTKPHLPRRGQNKFQLKRPHFSMEAMGVLGW